MKTTHWNTNRRYLWGRRADGDILVVGHRDEFWLLPDSVMPVRLAATSFPAALEEADRRFPPTGWSYVLGFWLSPGWKLKERDDEEGWEVFSEEGERRSSRVFPRSDEARRWCEIRQDRVGRPLRGPLKRADPAGEE
tara:strand:+ start:1137 stop:1547 length:411 start_codon:yes stop_codon:yes gene_type:complete